MATVWSVPKQEYDIAISNMNSQWVGETVSAKYIDEVFSQLVYIVWAFQRSISILLSNPDDEA